MVTERSFAISSRRRGLGRAAVFFGVALLLLCGCGRPGQGAKTDEDKASDVAHLNDFLERELTVLEAYEQVLPLLEGRALEVARRFQGQGQAHLDAITKAVRGIGGETDAEADELEPPLPKTERDALLLLYEAENGALELTLDSVPHILTTAASRLSAALAGSHAQHVAVFRQLLGTGLAASVPEPFENGDEPPPISPAEGG